MHLIAASSIEVSSVWRPHHVSSTIFSGAKWQQSRVEEEREGLKQKLEPVSRKDLAVGGVRASVHGSDRENATCCADLLVSPVEQDVRIMRLVSDNHAIADT